jgi:hypothetical protein
MNNSILSRCPQATYYHLNFAETNLQYLQSNKWFYNFSISVEDHENDVDGPSTKLPKMSSSLNSAQASITNFLLSDPSAVQESGVNLLSKKNLDYIADRISACIIGSSKHSSQSSSSTCTNSPSCTNLTSFLESESHDYELISEGEVHVIRCNTCFTYINDPVASSELLRKPSVALGTSLISGLVISNDDYKLYCDGGCQKWYNFKSRLLNHINDASQTHANATRHARKMIPVNARQLKVIQNQLRTAIGVVQSKSAVIHYETRIAELHNAGADVGDFGHSRVLFPQMTVVACSYIDRETQRFLSTNLPSTGLPPHFYTTADKSTNHRESNQVTLACPVVDGKRRGIPLGLTQVYSSSDGSGGHGGELAAAIFSDLKFHAKVEGLHLMSMQGKVTDSQYVNAPFVGAMNEPIFEVLRERSDKEDQKIILQDIWWECQWDPGHWLDKVFSKFHDSELITRLLGRVAMFHQLFRHGKMHSIAEVTAK